MLKVSKMLDKLVFSSRYNNELRPDGKNLHISHEINNLFRTISEYLMTRDGDS